MPGCWRTLTSAPSEKVPLKENTELPGVRITISAPTPRARCCASSTIPRLSPTRVSTMVTCTPMARALTSVRTGRLRRFSITSRLIKRYDTVTAMPNRSAFAASVRLCTLVCLVAGSARSQPTADFMARLDQFARTFTGAKAAIRSPNHVKGLPEDDVETGTIFVKSSGGRTQFLINFTQPNAYTAAVREQLAEVYHPKLNEIQEYDIRAYRDIAQKLFLLGFGMPGRELTGNYKIGNLKNETVDGQPATYMELIPKSPDVLKQLKSVEIWISDATLCPVRQTFHLPDGGSRSADFSAVEINPRLPANTFDLPKSAKRVRVN